MSLVHPVIYQGTFQRQENKICHTVNAIVVVVVVFVVIVVVVVVLNYLLHLYHGTIRIAKNISVNCLDAKLKHYNYGPEMTKRYNNLDFISTNITYRFKG